MDGEAAFRHHVEQLVRWVEDSLKIAATAGADFGGVVLHAGRARNYHADDLEVPFRTTPHFARVAPVPGPDHLILMRPASTPVLARVVPQDYWFAPSRLPDHPFPEVLSVSESATAEQAAAEIGDVSDCAYVGPDADVASSLGISAAGVEPAQLMAPLDWHRGFKTPYEVSCLREAARLAAPGHVAARRGVTEKLSERAIQAAYLRETGMQEGDTPYPNIIAWDANSAVLHYQARRTDSPAPGHSFLIDAGARASGYSSDITRTYTRPDSHPVFQAALHRMEALQEQLVQRVAPGTDFVELHRAAELGVCQILCDLDIMRGGADEVFGSGLAQPFLPHGLGHHLGLQVHDVGGLQHSAEGDFRPPPNEHPRLRTTRPLAVGNVVTIEPGLYFIPMLLDGFRGSADSAAFNWELIEELIPCGGIRIEDDVLVTESGCENLTRPWVPLFTQSAEP